MMAVLHSMLCYLCRIVIWNEEKYLTYSMVLLSIVGLIITIVLSLVLRTTLASLKHQLFILPVSY